MKNKPVRDLRSYAKSTTLRLIAGAFILIFVVGEILIYFIYGNAAAMTGLVCLLAGMVPVILILLSLWLIDRIANKNQK